MPLKIPEYTPHWVELGYSQRSRGDGSGWGEIEKKSTFANKLLKGLEGTLFKFKVGRV